MAGAPVSEAMKKAVETLAKRMDIYALENTSAVTGLRFVVHGQPVGVIRPMEWARLRPHCDGLLEQKHHEIHFKHWKSEADATKTFASFLDGLRKKDIFPCLRGWRNELYGVTSLYNEEPVLRIERAATFIFGTRNCGVDIHGCVEDEHGRLKALWLQRRSRTKEMFPGVLDVYVSGGLGADESPAECMKKECQEEASMTAEQCDRYVRPSGCVTYMYEDKFGLLPSISYCYDARLPDDYKPVPLDGEVEEFIKMPVSTSEELVALLNLINDPRKFKVQAVPIMADLLIRRGLIDSTFGSNFIKIAEIIHQPLYRQYPPKLA